MSPLPEAAWSVVVASALGLATGIATTIVATFGIFSSALTAEFGWAQGDVFAALMVVTLVAGLLGWEVRERLGAERAELSDTAKASICISSCAGEDYPRILRESWWGRHLTTLGMAEDIAFCGIRDWTGAVPRLRDGIIQAE